MLKKTLVVIIVGLIITGTIITLKQSKPIDKNLLVADKLMPDRPDSALRVLERLNANNFRGENKALYALLMTQAQFKNRKPVNSDSLIKIAYDYYMLENDLLRKAQTYFYLGRTNVNIKKANEALKNYQKASEAASKTDNYNLLALIYSHWGILLQDRLLYDDALSMLQKSLDYSRFKNDTLLQIFVLKDMGKVYFLKKDNDEALEYYKLALHLAQLFNEKSYLPWIYNNLSILYKSKGEYDKAMNCINKSFLLKSDSPIPSSWYFLKGDLFSLLHKHDSARYYLNKGYNEKDLISKIGYTALMSELEQRQRHFEKSLMYLNQYIIYADSFENQNKRSEIAELQKKYDYSLIKNENDKLKISRQQMQIVILAISLIALVSIILSLYYFYRKRSIKRAMKLEVDKMQHNLMNEKSNYYKVKTIEAQRNLIKEQELSRELSLKTEALKIHQEREKELKEHIFQMETVVKKIDAFNSMKPLQRIKSESQFTLTYQELCNLEEAMNLCHQQFAARLRATYPKLKDNDVHLCCLIKLKVPGKNVMGLLNLSELTLKKRKYRIKHEKMEMPVSVTSLDDFLSSF